MNTKEAAQKSIQSTIRNEKALGQYAKSEIPLLDFVERAISEERIRNTKRLFSYPDFVKSRIESEELFHKKFPSLKGLHHRNLGSPRDDILYDDDISLKHVYKHCLDLQKVREAIEKLLLSDPWVGEEESYNNGILAVKKELGL